ncbi:MAG: HigA family addiction module antitoxin [Mariprofundaceae bacterium]|nr:HigA family addiction module antitoxin [Mariprofundaceae bacterium]
MAMYNPTHPGTILREDVLKPLGLNVTTAAKALGISRNKLSRILDERCAVTAEMALRLELALGEPDAVHWLKLQSAYGLWQARSRVNLDGVEKLTFAG